MFKECSKCMINKNIDDYHKLKNGLFGRNSICKNCRSKLKKNNIFTTQTNIKKKKCINCNLIKDYENFYKNNSSKDGLQSYCKYCHKLKISNSNSKLNRFAKIILKKFAVKYKNIKININENDILNQYINQNGKCFITNHIMSHIFDTKQRTDNIWNMSINFNERLNELNSNNFKLVIHLIYTIKGLYNLSDNETLAIYNEITKNKRVN